MLKLKAIALGLVLLGSCGVPTQEESLLDAVRSRDIDRVRELSQNPVLLEERGASGQTPLIVAAMTDQFAMAETLLDAGSDPFAADRFGWTAGVAVEESMLRHGDEFEAKERFAQRLRQVGYPIPGPGTDEIKQLVAAGNWPPAEWTAAPQAGLSN